MNLFKKLKQISQSSKTNIWDFPGGTVGTFLCSDLA